MIEEDAMIKSITRMGPFRAMLLGFILMPLVLVSMLLFGLFVTITAPVAFYSMTKEGSR